MVGRTKIIITGLGLISFSVLAGSSFVAAQPVTLEQEIKPIECTYTTITTGGTPTTTTDCANQPLPVITMMTVTGIHLHMIGHFVAADTRTLTVWIAGQPYILGTSSGFSAVGDTWTLDLDMVQAGTYEVTLEAETTDNYLLRNMTAATFTITASVNLVSPQPPLSSDVVFGNEPTYSGSGFDVIPALPPGSNSQRPSPYMPAVEPSIDNHPITHSGTLWPELGVAAAVIIPLAGICLTLFIRGRWPK